VIDILEYFLVCLLFGALFFCLFMAIWSTTSPAPPPVPPSPANVVKITNPAPNEIHITIQTAPADAGVQKE
jgi:hypothetical protein